MALGPKGWGRAGPDCAIRIDSNDLNYKENPMNETIRFDGIDVALTKDSVTVLFAKRSHDLQEVKGRFDAMGQELEKSHWQKYR